MFSALAGVFFTTEPPGKPLHILTIVKNTVVFLYNLSSKIMNVTTEDSLLLTGEIYGTPQE